VVTDKGLDLHAFDGGIEIRITKVTKGGAVGAILSETGPGASVAYLGDDYTDEDAFIALDGHGLRVLVRTEERATRADIWIHPPQELLSFLDRWIAACQ
jgi:trehalose-phosphatase